MIDYHILTPLAFSAPFIRRGFHAVIKLLMNTQRAHNSIHRGVNL